MNLKPFIASTAAAAVLAGGALASATVGLLSPAQDDAVKMVPAEAFIYGNVFLDPSVPQKLALKNLIAKFPKASTPEEAKAAIARLLDQGLKELGMSFSADIEPWLGSQIAFFMMSPEGAPATGTEALASNDLSTAFLIATDDPSATQAALEKALSSETARSDPTTPQEPTSYGGVDLFVSSDSSDAAAVVDDFLVLGTEPGVKAVIDSGDKGSLGDSDRYAEAVSGLTEDRLATLYVDPSKALSGFPPGMVPPAFASMGPVTSILYARSDAIVFESSVAPGISPLLGTEGTDLIETLPGDTWAAFGIPAFGQALEQTIGQITGSMPGAPSMEMIEGQVQSATGLSLKEDVLSWLGDVAFFVRGGDVRSIGGGVVIKATDPAAAAKAMTKIKAALEKSGAPVVPLDMGNFDGFSIKDRFMPESINFVLADQRVVIAYGDDTTLAALGSDPSLSGDDDFVAAKAGLGDGFTVAGFVDVAGIVELFDKEASSDPVYRNNVKPYLDRISFVVFGSHLQDGRLLTRAVIGVQ
ncbi:MAG: hypothetical protein QOG16_1376 [Actinomycetota bacterium]|jgi:hypothetical protein|nr:hypothetical protein [Actinomycetota bacterium]